VIAINIDDGFSTSAVLADLAILEREHVNATWFPIGHVVASAPHTWRTVAAAGFPIANHTYDHAILTKYTYAQVLADIEKDNAVVSKVIGEALVPFVRPNGGSWNGTILAAAAAARERAVVLWDATTGDTAPLPGRTNVDLLVRNATKGTDGSIILMHANLPYTQQALPTIIAYYRERGFTFVTLGQMFGVPGPVPFPPRVATLSPASSPTPPPALAPTPPPALAPTPSPGVGAACSG
jgi:peptidoglycan/xylan/chitin deacetylase (PgdA/CDA1 family)